jgi:AraC-like DNA-binding protein
LSLIRFSTENYPEEERFEAWIEEVARRVAQVDVVCLDRADENRFHQATDILPLGEVTLNETTGTPINCPRSKKQVADGDDAFTFLINRRGPVQLIQGDSFVAHTKTSIVMIDHGRPLEHAAVLRENKTGERRAYGYTLPRRQLLAAAPGTEDYVGRPLPENDRILTYLLWYTEKLLAEPDLAADPVLAKSIGDHVFDLIATLLGPTKDAAEIARGRGLRAGRLMEILAHIDSHLSDPSLSAPQIAERHGISTRYLSQIMEEQGETLTHYISRKRLEKAIKMLTAPETRHWRISDIAYACGFSDISHFNHSFRRRFGDSPRSFRGSPKR